MNYSEDIKKMELGCINCKEVQEMEIRKEQQDGIIVEKAICPKCDK